MELSKKIGIIVLLFNLLVFLLFLNSNSSPSQAISLPLTFPLDSLSISNSSFSLPDLPPTITSNTSCNVYFPTLSQSQLQKIFNYKSYGLCSVPTNDSLSITDYEVKVTCKDESNPLFYFDDFPQRLGGRRQGIPWMPDTKGYESSEFLLIKCSEKSIYTFVFSRFKQLNSMKANSIKNKLKPDKKPFNVLFMVLDVVSRFNAHQNLPKVVQFIKQGFEEFTVSAYEFEKGAVPEIRTVFNMAQIIYGVTYETILETYGNKGVITNQKPKRGIVENPIWSYYSKLGFVTMFLHDSVSDYLATVVGRNIHADHVFVNYWKVAFSVYGWHDFSNKQRCAGPENSHNVSFTYAYKFFDNYPENNKFAYVHLDAAHESSGNIQTVDLDLYEFIKNFINLMERKQENFAFFIIGDHGRKVSSLNKSVLGYFESRVPFTSLILSKEVESKWDLKPILVNNTKKLFSRFDINLSLKHLAHFPYNKLYTFDYKHQRSSYPVRNPVSLFKEIISEERKCQDLGVMDEFCPCRWFETIHELETTDPVLFENLLKVVSEYFERKVAEETGCQELKISEDVKVEEFRINPEYRGLTTIFQVKFKANLGSQVEAKLNYELLSSKKPGWQSENVYRTFTHNGKDVYLEVERVSVTNSECVKNCIC